MSTTNAADASIALAADRLRVGRAAQRLTVCWTDDPHLTGWTPARVLDALARREHPDRDQLARGLVIRSQHHDQDATVLLLAALRPGLWRLAHTYQRARRHDAFDDLIHNALQVIARLDPTENRLYDRILGRTRAAALFRPRRHPEILVADLADHARGDDDDIVEQIDARDTLRRLGQLRRSGAVRDLSWDDLLAVRVHGRPAREIARGRSPEHVRADLSRVSTRLERLLSA